MRSTKLNSLRLTIILLIMSNMAFSQYYLPFSEDWHFGNFTINNWTTETSNWQIDSEIGNEAPSAKFHRTGILSDYSSSLISNNIDATTIKVGRIYLKFDLKLNDYNAYGTEYFKIKVQDSTGWHTIDSLNNLGSFDWETYKYDIKEFTKEQTFKFAFECSGQSSLNISDWFIDNIEVYRECDAPEELTGVVEWLEDNSIGAVIGWTSPYAVNSDDVLLHYDNGSNYTGIGTDNETDFEAAIFYEASDLVDNINDTIKRINFFLKQASIDYLIVKIWTGQNAETVIYSDTINNPVAGSWSNVEISPTILIEENTDYWFGYKLVNPQEQTLPAGTDIGPAIAGYGDKFRFEGEAWENLSDFSLDYNWNIQVELSHKPLLNPETLSGFNIFIRHLDESSYSKLDFVDYLPGKNIFEYIDTCFSSNENFCNALYKVNAVWGANGDTCVSNFANSSYIPEEDFVFVMFTEDVNDNTQKEIIVYPNPVTNLLNISFNDNIQNICIYSTEGIKLYERKVSNSDNIQINIGDLQKGFYILKIESNSKLISKKFIKL